MNQMTVRIESITINNFKNVVHGEIELSNPKKKYNADIVGLYGQNGSGKTALIDTVALLKYALRSVSVPVKYADFIHVDADHAYIKYGLMVTDKTRDHVYHVFYEFCLKKAADDTVQNTDSLSSDDGKYKLVLYDEVLSYSHKANNVKIQMQPVIDTRTEEAFGPKTKYDILTARNKSVYTDLLVAKKLALVTARSFVFSKELLDVIRANCQEQYHLSLLEALVNYGNFCLFVIDTTNSGLISLNALPLSFRYKNETSGAVGNLAIPLNGNAVIPKEFYLPVNNIIRNMNIVLSQIIPGLTISIHNLGEQILKNGKPGIKLQLMSDKNNKKIPLQYESEGIKKIVAILQLLIVVYNESSITVAIDELDSGVFEYLLGELLRIISEKGKGQLIFTSHNLRPLETLDKRFIAFTTTNPSNRYTRLVNVDANNNLRDFYYRDIILGELSEPLYESTNNSEIALAFREAGEVFGT